jgi:hypothetical protein
MKIRVFYTKNKIFYSKIRKKKTMMAIDLSNSQSIEQ